MSVKSILLFAGVAITGSVRTPDMPQRGCIAPAPSEEFMKINKQLAKEEAAAQEAGLTRPQVATAVDVYLHSVAGTEGGLLSVRSYVPPSSSAIARWKPRKENPD